VLHGRGHLNVMIPHPRGRDPRLAPCPCRSETALRWHCFISWPSCFAPHPPRRGHGSPLACVNGGPLRLNLRLLGEAYPGNNSTRWTLLRLMLCAAWAWSGWAEYCLQIRKSNDAKNLAKVIFDVVSLQSAMAPIRGSLVVCG